MKMGKTIAPRDGDPFRCRIDDAHPIYVTAGRSINREHVPVAVGTADPLIRRANSSHDAVEKAVSPATETVPDDGLGDRSRDSHAPFDSLDIADSMDVVEKLRAEHITQLICKLQDWSDALDRKEAELNARQAILDYSERTCRLKLQSQQLDLHEQERNLQQKQKSIESHLRRISLANFSFQP